MGKVCTGVDFKFIWEKAQDKMDYTAVTTGTRYDESARRIITAANCPKICEVYSEDSTASGRLPISR